MKIYTLFSARIITAAELKENEFTIQLLAVSDSVNNVQKRLPSKNAISITEQPREG